MAPKSMKSVKEPKLKTSDPHFLAGHSNKFSTYIAKAHRSMHGKELTISSTTLANFDLMTDFVLNKLISNVACANKYSKLNTLNKRLARAAVELTLTGLLKDEAIATASNAVIKYSTPREPVSAA